MDINSYAGVGAALGKTPQGTVTNCYHYLWYLPVGSGTDTDSDTIRFASSFLPVTKSGGFTRSPHLKAGHP